MQSWRSGSTPAPVPQLPPDTPEVLPGAELRGRTLPGGAAFPPGVFPSAPASSGPARPSGGVSLLRPPGLGRCRQREPPAGTPPAPGLQAGRARGGAGWKPPEPFPAAPHLFWRPAACRRYCRKAGAWRRRGPRTSSECRRRRRCTTWRPASPPSPSRPRGAPAPQRSRGSPGCRGPPPPGPPGAGPCSRRSRGTTRRRSPAAAPRPPAGRARGSRRRRGLPPRPAAPAARSPAPSPERAWDPPGAPLPPSFFFFPLSSRPLVPRPLQPLAAGAAGILRRSLCLLSVYLSARRCAGPSEASAHPPLPAAPPPLYFKRGAPSGASATRALPSAPIGRGRGGGREGGRGKAGEATLLSGPPPPRPPLWLSGGGGGAGRDRAVAAAAAASAPCGGRPGRGSGEAEGEAGSQRLTAAGKGREASERPEPAHRYGRAVNKPLAPLPGPARSPRGTAAAPSGVPPQLGQGEKSETPAQAVCKQQGDKEKPPQNAPSGTHAHPHSHTRDESRLPALPSALGPCGAPMPTLLPQGRAASRGTEAPSSRALGASAVLRDSCPPPLGTPYARGLRAGTAATQLSLLLFNKRRESTCSCPPLDMFPICTESSRLDLSSPQPGKWEDRKSAGQEC